MAAFNIEDHIQHAQEAGEFNQLRGRGKPFTHLDRDPFAHLVDEQGFVPHWLEIERDIRTWIEIARQSIARTYEWVLSALNGGSVDRLYARDEWTKARRIFDQRLAEINQLIKTLNLALPEPLRHLQRFPLNAEEELRRMGLTKSI